MTWEPIPLSYAIPAGSRISMEKPWLGWRHARRNWAFGVRRIHASRSYRLVSKRRLYTKVSPSRNFSERSRISARRGPEPILTALSRPRASIFIAEPFVSRQSSLVLDPALAREALRRLRAAGTPCELEVLLEYPVHRVLPVAEAAGVPVRIYVPFGNLAVPYSLKQITKNPRIAGWAVRDLLRWGRRAARRIPSPVRASPEGNREASGVAPRPRP